MIDHDAILLTIKALGQKDKPPLSIDDLVEETGVVRRTIQRHIRRLRAFDMISVTHTSGKKNNTCFYKLKLG